MAIAFSRPQEDGINVFVRYVNGKTHCFWVDPYNDSVADTKKRVVEKNDGEDVVFTWNGKPLEDSLTLADYGPVTDGLTIHAYPRQRGGCFMVSFTILCIIIMAIIGSMCTCGLSLAVVPFLMPLLFVLPLFCL